MQPSLHQLVGWSASLAIAILFGLWIATGYTMLLVLVACLCVFVAAIVIPGNFFFVAVGVLCPVTLPLPLINRFPMVSLIAGFVIIKEILTHTVAGSEKGDWFRAIKWPIALFFGWIFIRYCMNPVRPGMALGLSDGVTGFRAYFSYLSCFLLLIMFGRVFSRRQDMLTAVKWFRRVAFVSVAILVPLTFTKSLRVAEMLSMIGIHPSLLDNGMLRIVSLPGLGLILVALALLPKLAPLSKWKRICLLTAGMVAVVVGCNRSTFIEMLLILIFIQVLRKRYLRAFAVTAVIAATLGGFYFIGENMKFTGSGFGLLRVLSVASSRVASSSGASDTLEWRKIRWNMAMEEIKKRPFVGRSYGGLEHVVWGGSYEQFEREMQEVDLANGGIHNGYLACAVAFGIPAALFFLYILFSHLALNWRRAREFLDNDPVMGELHAFVFVGILCLFFSIYIGCDLNDPSIWMYLGMSVLLVEIKKSESAPKKNSIAGTTRESLPVRLAQVGATNV